MSLGGILTAIGFVLLGHCAWGASNYRDMLKLTQQEFTGLPQQLQLELLASLAVCLIGGYLVAGSMKPIILSKGAPSMDVGSNRQDFVTVNHRGAALPLLTSAS